MDDLALIPPFTPPLRGLLGMMYVTRVGLVKDIIVGIATSPVWNTSTRARPFYASCHKPREREKPHRTVGSLKCYTKCAKRATLGLCCARVFGVAKGSARFKFWKKP